VGRDLRTCELRAMFSRGRCSEVVRAGAGAWARKKNAVVARASDLKPASCTPLLAGRSSALGVE
jgi:hypothetical protein